MAQISWRCEKCKTTHHTSVLEDAGKCVNIPDDQAPTIIEIKEDNEIKNKIVKAKRRQRELWRRIGAYRKAVQANDLRAAEAASRLIWAIIEGKTRKVIKK